MSYLDFVAAADSHNVKAGGSSFFDDPISAVGGAVSGAVVSGLGSIYNTGVDYTNKLFGNDADKIDTSRVISSIDTDWGAYYNNNKDAIDTMGFIATSFIPGGLAVKGLKLARSGEMFGGYARTIGGFASARQTATLERALAEVAQEGGTVFSRIQGAKLESIAWGTADMVLQTAAYETATALTMKSSPMLEKEDWGHIFWDITKTSLLGGVIGGGIEGILTNKLVKDAAKLVDKSAANYRVLRSVENTDLVMGDKAFGIIDSILDMPPEALAVKIPFAKAKGGILDATGYVNKTRRDTLDRGFLELEQKLTTAVEADKTIGRPVARALIEMTQQGMEQGVDPARIKSMLGEHLLNLVKIDTVHADAVSFEQGIRYLTPRADITLPGQNLLTPNKQKGDIAYRVIGDEAAAKHGILGQHGIVTNEAAWSAGFDWMIDPVTKNVHFNPNSSVYRRIDPKEAALTSVYFNTAYKTTSNTVVPTAADIALTGKDFAAGINASGVIAGNRAYVFRAGAPLEATADSIERTARHAWAAKLNKIDGSIDATDISVLDALLQDPTKASDKLKVFSKETGEIPFADIQDFDNFVFDQKMKLADTLLQQADDVDFRKAAYHLNVEPQWLENRVAQKFDRKAAFEEAGWSRPLESYLERENVVFRYATDNLDNGTFKTTGLIDWNTRVKEATERSVEAARIVLGDEHVLFIPLTESLAREASGVPSGAGMLASANADYSSRINVWAQDSGKNVAKVGQARAERVLNDLQNPLARILNSPDDAAELVAITTRARTVEGDLSIFKDPTSQKYMLVDTASYKKAFERPLETPSFNVHMPISDNVGDFLTKYHDSHKAWIGNRKVLAAAHGKEIHWDSDVMYLPPVDTRRVPFFAFVRQTDGTLFGSSEVGMITARNAAELQARAAQIEKNAGLKVIYKADTEAFHKAKGDYDFSRALNSPVINNQLRSEHKLGDYLPSFVPEDIVEDFVQFVQKREIGLTRDAVSTNYGQTFAELQSMSERSKALQTSKYEGLGRLFTRNVVDPWGDYLKTALNISKRGEFTLWHQLNEFVDAMGTTAYRGLEKTFIDARAKTVTWEEANNKLVAFGMGPHFDGSEAFRVAQTGPDRNLIKVALQKANMLLANSMLRLDFANSLLNVMSTPILLGTEVSAIRRSLKKDPEMFARFESNLKVAVPDTEGKISVPSTTKLLFKAVSNMFGEGGDALRKRYADINVLKDSKSLYHDMVGELSLTPGLIPSEYAKTVDKWVERGASFTGNNRAEEITRFVSADVMRQMTQDMVEAGKMSVQEQNAFISIFVNRVQGNHIASQRPILFQGTLGSAIGLFQTYQFNLFQQLYRHIENKDLKTIAVMGGLQTTLFGLNGVPFFDAINTQIVGGASINEKHKDMYSMAVQGFGKEVGDWLMYGTPSAMPFLPEKMPALYTRGDLNPRNMTIVPLDPRDVPAVQAATRVVGTLVGMGERIAAGGSVGGSLLYGLEHNGMNRPLAGLAQVMSGRATTGKGDLISASADFNSISTAARLMGAKPMDESIGLNQLYRNKAYQAMDRDKIEVLGAAIKEKLRGHKQITSDEWVGFQGSYAAAGGRIQGFSQALQRWDTKANVSVINEAMRHNNTAGGQRLIDVMGGNGLIDYNNAALYDE